jgi:hypothetical protein
MNPVGALILLLVIFVVLTASRRWALLAVMAGVLYLTQGQQIAIFGFNLYAIRFIELAGFIRIMTRKEFSFFRLNRMDRVFLLLYIYTTAVFLFRSSEGYANQIGIAVDAFLCYFTFRGLVGGIDDFRWFLRAFILLLAPYTVLVLFESVTRHNPFSFMGGVVYGDWLREGRLRCQGSFRHASLLGTLGASFLPLYIGLACSKTTRRVALFGIILCMLIVWASNSGGPANCAIIGIAGWLFWPVRTRMKLIRRLITVGTVLLAMVMKAPIWYLPAKASSLTGGDGWHRSYLMDVAFRNFDKWWLDGMSLKQTKDWFYYSLATTGGADITNQFLSFGFTAGVISMILFFVLLYLAFSNLGKALAVVRSGYNQPNESEFLLWGLGTVIVVHLFNWLGITYFDQTYVIWFMQLAAISNFSEQLVYASVIPTGPASTEIDPHVYLGAGNKAAGLRFGG